MAKFRVPRKTKKKIKKDLWLYPFDEKSNGYRVAFPSESQEEYNDWKNGVLNGCLGEIKKRYKEEGE
jgi:hypothetical protein